MSNSFYVILPSNTPIDGNTSNSFLVRLPKKLQFNSEWVVGLSVISYSHSWPCFATNEQQFINLHWRSNNVISTAIICFPNFSTPKEIENGLVESLSEIIHANIGTNTPSPIVFEYVPYRQKFRLKIDENVLLGVKISKHLGSLLGFTEFSFTKSVYARYRPDLNAGLSSLFVYSPGLIEPVVVGNICAPLLRIVNVKNVPNETIEEAYVAVQYYKLLIKEISEIYIEIKTPYDELVPFEFGNTTLTLHFKKVFQF